jgi:hypothetical protein
MATEAEILAELITDTIIGDAGHHYSEDTFWQSLSANMVARGFAADKVATKVREARVQQFIGDQYNLAYNGQAPYDSITDEAQIMTKMVEIGLPLGFTKKEIEFCSSPGAQYADQFNMDPQLLNEIFAFFGQDPMDVQGASEKFPDVPVDNLEFFAELSANGGLIQS